MTNPQIYLPTVLPQWGIFAGFAALLVGYIEKKEFWTRIGWIILMAIGLAGLYFNLFGDLFTLKERNGSEAAAVLLISAGWQLSAGGVLAGVSLLLFLLKTKRYPILAILTIIYFVLIFFQYTQISGIASKTIKPEVRTEQKQ